MKYAVFFLLLFPSSCKDHEWTDDKARNIEGFWRESGHPEWFRLFSNGYCQERVFDFGQVIAENEYSYRTNGDTVFLENLRNGSARTWITRFITPDSVEVEERGALIIRRNLVRT